MAAQCTAHQILVVWLMAAAGGSSRKPCSWHPGTHAAPCPPTCPRHEAAIDQAHCQLGAAQAVLAGPALVQRDDHPGLSKQLQEALERREVAGKWQQRHGGSASGSCHNARQGSNACVHSHRRLKHPYTHCLPTCIRGSTFRGSVSTALLLLKMERAQRLARSASLLTTAGQGEAGRQAGRERCHHTGGQEAPSPIVRQLLHR